MGPERSGTDLLGSALVELPGPDDPHLFDPDAPPTPVREPARRREPPAGAARLTSTVPGFSVEDAREALEGLPPATGYSVHVIPLRYREKPHLSAWTQFNDKTITIQIPEPFFPFGEIVPYAARRKPGRGKKLRFIWLTEGITFRTPREVVRFLYCHEWMHWYLRERLGR
jgi:hypothetical protein